MSGTNYAEICARVRWQMKLSQKELAKLIGSNQTEISFLERGFVPKDTRKIERIMELAQKVGIVEG